MADDTVQARRPSTPKELMQKVAGLLENYHKETGVRIDTMNIKWHIRIAAEFAVMSIDLEGEFRSRS